MKNICIIPARGGSKRIPRKNIKEFRGVPMIKWSIEAAIKSNAFESIVVSTDDAEIAQLAQRYGAEIPIMRPQHLSDDFTDTKSVVNHMIGVMEEEGRTYDFVCCLYATAPFVRPEDIKDALNIIQTESDNFVFPVTNFSYPIQRALRRNKAGYTNMVYKQAADKRSQDLEEMYHDAGQFYIASPKRWRKNEDILNGSTTIVLPNWRVQDIDNESDWVKAEVMHEILEREQKDINKQRGS